MAADITENIVDAYPLAPMQTGMLFHSLSAETSDDFLSCLKVDITGNLDVEIFQLAWEEIYRQHASLRTCSMHDGLDKPLQLVNKHVTLEWSIVTSDITTETRYSIVQKRIKVERNLVLDLTRAPLSRFTLIKFSETSHTLIWTVHHLVADGGSIPIVLNELKLIYNALVQNKTFVL